MFRKLRKSKRGVSEVLAVVIIMGLVLGASGLVAIVLLNIEDVNFLESTDTTQSQTVKLSIEIVDKNDTDFDSLYDTITLNLSLSEDSVNRIYIHDIDLMLPTGQSLDDLTPWLLSSEQFWKEEYKGYVIYNGTDNLFLSSTENLNQNEGEIKSGISLYFVVYYSYQSGVGSRKSFISTFYQSSLQLIS